MKNKYKTQHATELGFHLFLSFNPFTTEARFYVLNAMAFSTLKRASVVEGLKQ